jgi:glycosyltransferase involved in cell wall biosynthesis
MFHNIAKFMISKGHEVRVLLYDAKEFDVTQSYNFEGVEVFPPGQDKSILFGWAEIVFTHLGRAAESIVFARIFKKPIIFISQNFHHYEVVKHYSNETPDTDYKVWVLYNSHYMAQRLDYKCRSIIVHPPVDWRRYEFDGPTGEYITLINMNLNKGARLFLALCRAMPEKQFLAVKGSYDTQFLEDIPNLTIWDNSPNMERVYRATRILVIPSAFESWGMVATEAMSNGIPIIYNSTPGLRENVGESGIELHNLNPDYEEKDLKGGEHPGIDPAANLDQWMRAIRKLNTPTVYKKYSNLSRKRSRELDPGPELEQLEKFIHGYF